MVRIGNGPARSATLGAGTLADDSKPDAELTLVGRRVGSPGGGTAGGTR